MRFDVTTNAAELARQNHWRASRVLTTLHEAAKHNARLLKRFARQISGLTCHSLEDLRRMGHPYAKQRPRPPHPVYEIHTHSGGYRRGWFARTKMHNGDSVIEFGNSAEPIAGWLEDGTRKMIARGPVRYTVLHNTDEMQLNNRRAYRSALGLHGAAAASRSAKYLKTLG